MKTLMEVILFNFLCVIFYDNYFVLFQDISLHNYHFMLINWLWYMSCIYANLIETCHETYQNCSLPPAVDKEKRLVMFSIQNNMGTCYYCALVIVGRKIGTS